MSDLEKMAKELYGRDEVLYYNPKTRVLSLKTIYTGMSLAMILLLGSNQLSDEEKEQIKNTGRLVRVKSVKVHEDDQFDLLYGYALLSLHETFGSKRKRQMWLEKKFGSLATESNKRDLTVIAAMAGRDYDEYESHVKAIYANEKVKE